jgi:hypothetical protein
MSEETQASITSEALEDAEYIYFPIDKDLSKGDRRADGKLNDDFFGVVDSSRIIDNVRVSQRLGKRSSVMIEEQLAKEGVKDVELRRKRICAPPMPAGDKVVGLRPSRVSTPRIPGASHEVQVHMRRMCMPRGPDKGIKCAGRHRTSRLLWLHEYFVVYENGNRKQKVPMVYQALQFLFGAQLPEGVVDDISDKQAREIWVLGISYLPAAYVRNFSRRQTGYIFHTELNEGDADKALYGKCPELVRVQNSLKWHAMSTVSLCVPRVVHADDVKQRRMHVAGRRLHYVVGVTAIQDLKSQSFKLLKLARGDFVTYPEERSGMELQSASMMWGHVDDIFMKIRQCMSAARQGTSSASFKMPCCVAAHVFWKV